MTPRRRSRRWLPAAVTHRWTRVQHDPDRGSITAYLLIMTVALVVLAGLVLDGGAALTAHGTAADTAQQAARAGADALDEQSLRASAPAGLTTNPAAAREAAAAVLAAADVTGDITVTGSTVTVTAAPPSRPRSWPSSASTRSAAPPPPPRSRCTAPPPERPDMTHEPTPPATDPGES